MKWARQGRTLLLACAKCQRKLRGEEDPAGLGRLRKTLKREAKRSDDPLKLRMIETGCLKVCPKGGVVVASNEQLAQGECGIVRSEDDLRMLVAGLQRERAAKS